MVSRNPLTVGPKTSNPESRFDIIVTMKTKIVTERFAVGTPREITRQVRVGFCPDCCRYVTVLKTNDGKRQYLATHGPCSGARGVGMVLNLAQSAS